MALVVAQQTQPLATCQLDVAGSGPQALVGRACVLKFRVGTGSVGVCTLENSSNSLTVRFLLDNFSLTTEQKSIFF